ncbi:tRNA (adenosine(37)-N6)-dimethylallyltransferase MiaA [Quadrisphaera sp. DSM 44207]|uniref:tRNA (adenosine(37)-N6)-dimethylallyltransferase MiaA n=1 Tax=Quadrisphaera sp. DSM 44207 TaxID=1881057 RepID=UPI000B825033|nr:tRNA (adenosine(37)-N6)-dimethylallyltransferase MiaA [Quadrisphaera sp. DSM 44207]
MVEPDARVVAVVGPTATGKSDLAVALARALDGEVVNADASQLYRGMDVGTAKLPVPARRGVPHHLLDVLDVTQEARVAAYQRAARAAFDEVAARGRVPVLVGGSGLYVRAALDALEFPATDPAVRARLEAEAAALGPAALHARLAALDPAAAAAIQPGNVRRVVRALEVGEVTGRPFSATMPVAGRYAVPAVQVGLSAEREVLRARIGDRVHRMVEQGLVAEVEALLARGLREGSTARRALGYAQVLDALDGACTLEEAVAATVHATRRYARRQLSWFGRDPRVHWLRADRSGPGELLAAALAIARPALGRS